MCARPRGEIEKTERSVGWKASRRYSEARSFSSNAKVKRGMGVGQRAAARWRGWWYGRREKKGRKKLANGAARRAERNNEEREETGREKERARGEVFFCGLSRAYVISDSTSEGAGPARLSWSSCARVVEKRDGEHRGDTIQTRTRDFQRRRGEGRDRSSSNSSSSSSSSSRSHG